MVRKENYMKRILVLLTLFIGINLFADAGKAYRFLVSLESNKENVHGYIYYYTYYEDYPDKNNLLAFFKRKNNHKKIRIFNEIKTVNNIDFSTYKFQNELLVDEIKAIKVEEIIEFIPDDKIVIISNEEYSLIVPMEYNMVKLDLNDSFFYENCYEAILFHDKNIDILKLKEELTTNFMSILQNEKISEYKKGEKINILREKLRRSLVKRGIVLFLICDVL